MSDYKELIGDIRICLIAQPNQTLYKQLLREAANAIAQLCADVTRLEAENRAKEQYIAETIGKVIKERNAAVDDLEKCMHYAEPKNNNVCNFCKKDMSEYPDKCDGWSDFCKCEPEWRGVQKESE